MATEYLQNGNVKIVYISSHTNHILGIKECKHLPLPQSVKGYIQQRFAAGVSLERILDGMATANHANNCMAMHSLYQTL